MRIASLSAARMAIQLVHLPEVERLSPACIRILGGNPGKFTLQGTNTYILGTGSKRLLIDTGEGKPSWIAAIKKTLEEEKASIASSLISHWHHDHVGGISQLLDISPETKIYKNEPESGQSEISDGQNFKVDGASLTAFHTPGHTVDHMVFVFEEEDAMFTADNVLGQGTAVFEDLHTYLASLAQMKKLFKGKAYPGHGPVIDDGPAKIQEYIMHRQQRENQVLETLRSPNASSEEGAAWAPMELVKVIYADVPESLHLPAQGGVIQILKKLEKEGKVSQEGGRWRLKDRSTL
ncbi:putative metallo-beta-lactamase domain protein [Phaeoacremonium minimum UCRPA7]|uniref:Putative metallo-beta-lactamase domain protein n=1 Tax=Phaeoacremonium minimum (strain UCR-PA7) TaxID=1286976 RepID=R8BTC3_PHAM7|nr:putative metallo-beta-lactamase domain protein [Phaeoacremonium minimum UCRPA7]EOO02554.1 putative metallo-beta-lactamase domain protein [Phaeoacremonium minimum UCRPA7]